MPVYVLFDLSDYGVLLKVKLQVTVMLSKHSCLRGAWTNSRKRKGKTENRATRGAHLNQRGWRKIVRRESLGQDLFRWAPQLF